MDALDEEFDRVKTEKRMNKWYVGVFEPEFGSGEWVLGGLFVVKECRISMSEGGIASGNGGRGWVVVLLW
jgi:hypothetical protein